MRNRRSFSEAATMVVRTKPRRVARNSVEPALAPPGSHPDVIQRHRHDGIDGASISGASADPVLAEIQEKLSPFLTLVGGWRGVITTLKALRAEEYRATNLDLIGHSGPDNLLEIGTWIVGKDAAELQAFCHEAKPLMQDLGMTAIRLIGCNTVEGVLATAVLKALEDKLGCDAFGAGSMVFANAFSYRQCIFQNLSRPSQAGGPVAMPPGTSIEEELAKLPTYDEAFQVVRATPRAPEPRDVQLVAEELVELDGLIARDRGWRLPGLLRKPSLVLSAPRPDGTVHPIDVLFGGELVRISPRADPPIYYRPKDLTAFKAFLADLRARTAPPGRS